MAQHTGIRVKSMAILLSLDGGRQAVSRLGPTAEHPRGFHRLLGGSVEHGERAADALARELRKELGADVVEAHLVEVVENIFTMDGEPGHEVVFVYATRLADAGVIPQDGGTFTDGDAPLQVVWRQLSDTGEVPLFPVDAVELARVCAANAAQLFAASAPGPGETPRR
ncbi:NUDIX domain-containing protein [Flexivirga sp. ID2601S]|uniref:NUDIX domain-containing protein n=1 Tax=Flexivirga aerilata TaxID=1656889 RepID=A0A849AJS4_9MICO|nr:NUDIX domain-containing protein [Flexivirga aerilata]NNG39508.1 NUDIX domain-containing protein [Flexivirga aerilata]